ncbi:DNA-binding CsgD family transcriptional regulator [Rhizobium sp. BK650]|uniref:helix-turn-helix transcriptional regulator n=1 Tax=Rhizobium sp. BK650 TaxID=2586990 RepID=UPI001619F683|nr:helix-turn-helix transcriptional regulator [Rhizobium sp. BK650]MBB3656298.1 DNA-binding CsgD family transcriptional regulator [Rhizobium sp. BK650]
MPGSPHAKLEVLTDLIYGALFGETSWQAFLDALTATMPDAKSTLFFHDAVARTGGLSLSSGLETAEIEAYNRYYAAINPWMPRAAIRPIGLGVIADQMLPREQLLKTEFYNDYIRWIGCESSVGVTIMREHGRSFNLSTLTFSADPDFNRSNAELLSDLAPHLRRAFDFIRREHSNPHRDENGLALFDAIGIGIVYIGEDQAIRSINSAAEEMIAEGEAIGVSTTGRILINDNELASRLSALLCRRVPALSPASTRIRMKNASFKCTLIKMQSDFITDFLEGPRVAMIIERTRLPMCPDPDDAMPRIDRLTAAEMRVAAGIAAGLSLREVARANDVSYETARSHLKNIYSKLGVNSQVGLVRRLMP